MEMDSDIDKNHLSGVNTDVLIEVSSKENRLVALFFFRTVYQYLIKLQMKVPCDPAIPFLSKARLRLWWILLIANGAFHWAY